MSVARKQKEAQVEEIVNLISKSKIIIIWDYLGLNANEISSLRTNLKNNQAINKVYKNRIAKIAFEKSNKKEILNDLVGPTSFMFIEDENSKALKELNDFIKKNDKVEFKAGYIDGKFYDKAGLIEVAGLPSKEEMLSMLLSVLQGSMRNFAYALSQIKK